MSKNTLGIFKNGMYALRENRDFLAQLPNEDGILYSASSSHFYAGHKPPSLKKQAFLIGLIQEIAEYVSIRSSERGASREEKGIECSEAIDCDRKLNAAFAFSELLESGGYYKEVFVEKLNQKEAWKSIQDGRLAKIVCQYLKEEPGYTGCDFNTSLGRGLAINKWQQSLLGAIKKSKTEFEEKVKPFPNRWTNFNTIKYMKKNPGCTSLVIAEGFEDVDSHSFDQCMGGIHSIVIRSPMGSLSGYDFLRCPDLKSLILSGTVSNMDDMGSFSVLEDLVHLEINQRLKTILRNSLRNITTFQYLKVVGGVDSIGKGAFSGFSTKSVIQLGVMEGITAAREKAIVVPQVGQVEACAFLGSAGIQAVLLGAGVSVKDLAFSKCPGLSFVVIHDDVRDVNGNAFFSCEGLQCVVAPERILKHIKEFYIIEFGFEKAEGVHFIRSNAVADHKSVIEGHMVRLRESGIVISSPNGAQWRKDPATTENTSPNELNEASSANPFEEASDEEERISTDDRRNPFGIGRLSDVSAIASRSHRSSSSLSVESEIDVGNPF